MRKTLSSLLMMASIAGAGLAAPGPREKAVQFSAGGSFMWLKAKYEDNGYALFGLACRADLNIGRSISVAPEISGGIGGFSGGGTLNVRAGKFFIGAGYLAAGGFESEWGLQALVKAHAGVKTPRGLIAAALLANRWFKGFGLTAAYVF